MERIKHNLQFFLFNYVLVTGILFALSVISSPSAIVGLLCLGGAWVGVVRMTSSGSVTIKGMSFLALLFDVMLVAIVIETPSNELISLSCAILNTLSSL